MNITDIWEAMNGKAESFFEWAQALLPDCLPYGSQAYCFVGNGRATGSSVASYGYLTIASLKHAAGFRWCWSVWR